MKTMTVFEARNHFARMLEAAKEDVIIVTRNGKPAAAIQAIGDDDIEDDCDRDAAKTGRRSLDAPAESRSALSARATRRRGPHRAGAAYEEQF